MATACITPLLTHKLPIMWNWIQSNIIGKLFGAKSILSNLGDFLGNHFNSWLDTQTGAAPTGATLQAQEYQTDEREAAQDWTAQREDTELQRRVADANAAGINPLFVVGAGGVSSASRGQAAPSSTTGQPFSLSDLLGLIRLKSELDLTKANTQSVKKDIEAKQTAIEATKQNIAKSAAETAGIELDNNLKALTLDMKVQAQELENQYKGAAIRKFWKEVDEIEMRIGKIVVETKTEESKQVLLGAEAWLRKCEASQILQLLPYEKKLKESQSALNAAKTEEAKAAAQNQYAQASLAAVHEAYQQQLVDSGYVDSLAKEMAAKAGFAESSEELAAIKTGLRTGKWPDSLKDKNIFEALWSGEGMMQTLTVVLDNLNPLAGLLK